MRSYRDKWSIEEVEKTKEYELYTSRITKFLQQHHAAYTSRAIAEELKCSQEELSTFRAVLSYMKKHKKLHAKRLGGVYVYWINKNTGGEKNELDKDW